MGRTTRRTFVRTTGAALAGAAVAASTASRARGANDRVRIGLIGCGGRGTKVAEEFAALSDAQVIWVCDPDAKRLGQTRQQLDAAHAAADLRRLLEDKNVDAVIVATPDHWHGPAAILAADAGKHVYVEKPCSHNIREGRLMVDAARRNKITMQVGTQARSSADIAQVIGKLRDGAIGDVLSAKAVNTQRRKDIGHANITAPPHDFDYNLWVGPAPMMPFRPTCHHYTWHWWYNFGTGDMGNDGVHELDIARWGLGVEEHPATVSAHGTKLFFDDDQQFPDTQMAVFEYPGEGGVGHRRTLIFEQRIWTPYADYGYDNCVVFYGTQGRLVLGKGRGWKLFGVKDELKAEGEARNPTSLHVRDFIDAARSGTLPNADIEIGHRAATLTHLGNIAARFGRTLKFDGVTERIVADEPADRFVRRAYRRDHWAVPRGVET